MNVPYDAMVAILQAKTECIISYSSLHRNIQIHALAAVLCSIAQVLVAETATRKGTSQITRILL